MDRDQIVSRVFELMGVSQEDIVLRFLPLRFGLCGYWTEPGFPDSELKPLSDEKCTIGMNDGRLDEYEIVKTLAHELCHHTQWVDGKIRAASSLETRKKIMFWNGEAFKADSGCSYREYHDFPWEQEARAMESTIWYLYCETYLDAQYVA